VSARTRLLGVDYGDVRIGLAISDPTRLIASPLATYERVGTDRDAGYFRRLVEAEHVGGLVVGLPIHLSGEEGEKARAARAYGAWLAEATGLKVVFWDERYTTKIAEEALRDAGLSAGRRKQRRDKVAAQVMLQSYLDAGCPDSEGISHAGTPPGNG
jgi:putative Holliday junction resolvase